MKLCKFSEPGYQNLVDTLVNRSSMDLFAQDEMVRKILNDVKEKGDEELLRLTHQFDRHTLPLEKIRVTSDEIKAAYREISQKELDALGEAAKRIRLFHERQKQDPWTYEEEGIVLGQMVRPLEIAGIYVPGGKASYPSSVLMNAIPAKVAGVERIVMCSPFPEGQTRPHVLVAADLAGVTEIYKIGGAGPSEILIVADHSAKPSYVAADLLSQAEHDEDAVPILVTPDEALAEDVKKELEKQVQVLSKKDIAEISLRNNCYLLVTESLQDAVDMANKIAPEHLELSLENPEEWAKKVQNAGAVFMGHYTPEALGDYLAGPNHVLPTSGTARFSSPLGVYDFIKRTSLISYTREALQNCGKTVTLLAEMEDLGGHANSVKLRLDGPEKKS